MYDFRVAAGVAGGFGLVALLFAVPAILPPAVAKEEPARTLLSSAEEIFPPPFDPDSLVKWEYELDPAVSTEVTHQSTVKKIGFGRSEVVQIVRTPTGTYSTDGLTSPHVEYPDIHKKKRAAGKLGLFYWSNGRWVLRHALTAGSFVTVTPFDGGQLIVTDDGMCVVRKNGTVC